MSNSMYSTEQYIKPFWLSDMVINESVLPHADENGKVYPYRFDCEFILLQP